MNRTAARLAFRLVWITLLLVPVLTGCEGLVGTEPTRTPTRTAMPPLAASPTINPLPPTPIANESGGQFAGSTNLTAAAAPNNSDLRPETTLPGLIRPELVNITALDGSLLAGELYRPPGQAAGTQLPGVVILKTPVDDWHGLPVLLRDAGIVALMVEVRLPALPGDVDAMLETLAADPTVNPDRIAVIGAETGADTALLNCAQTVRCAALVMLTPLDRPALLNVMTTFNQTPRPLLLAVSSVDLESARTAEAIRLSAQGDVRLEVLTETATTTATTADPNAAPGTPQPVVGTGTQMLVNRPELTTLIVTWLDSRLAG